MIRRRISKATRFRLFMERQNQLWDDALEVLRFENRILKHLLNQQGRKHG